MVSSGRLRLSHGVSQSLNVSKGVERPLSSSGISAANQLENIRFLALGEVTKEDGKRIPIGEKFYLTFFRRVSDMIRRTKETMPELKIRLHLMTIFENSLRLQCHQRIGCLSQLHAFCENNKHFFPSPRMLVDHNLNLENTKLIVASPVGCKGYAEQLC